jgi:glycosyltransferase involved in cell wall biosynthesis
MIIYFFTWTSLWVKKSITIPKKSLKDKLTIFMITNNYKPYAGGIVTALDSYSAELRSQGHRVVIITLDFLGGKYSPENDVIRIWCPIRFKYHNNYMAMPWRPTKKIYDLAISLKPDIIHVFHPFVLGVSGLKVGNKLSIPVAFTYMTLYDQYAHYVPLPLCITQPITNYIVDDFCEKVDILIAPSQSAKEHIIKQGVTHKAYVLPLSILPIYLQDHFTPKPTAHNQIFTLLFVSRFTKEKNVSFLLDVFKSLNQKNYQFILIGFGELEESLKAYAYETLGLSHDAVKFIIKPSKEEIRDWYDKADLFIFASLSDTQGLVLAESMARGTPVVALKAPGVVDIVKNGINGFMVDNKTEMKEIIEKIEQDRGLFEILQKNAWITGNQYSAKNCTATLLKIYDRFLNAR